MSPTPNEKHRAKASVIVQNEGERYRTAPGLTASMKAATSLADAIALAIAEAEERGIVLGMRKAAHLTLHKPLALASVLIEEAAECIEKGVPLPPVPNEVEP